MNNEEKVKEVQKYLEHDEDTLYSLLSLHKSSEKEGLKFLPGQEVDQGKKYFAEIEKILFENICIKWEYCKKRQDKKFQENENLIVVIFDIIASLTIGFPPALLTTLILKKGLDNLCNCL